MTATSAPIDVSVITSGHDVADARLHREVAALVAHGLRVEVLGLGDVADGPPCVRVRTWPRPGMLLRAQLAARMAASADGRVLFTLDPDSAVAANAVVLSSGRVLVVDVHEDFARLLADRPWAAAGFGIAGHAARGLIAAFMAVARRAALTVVADEHVPPRRARNRFVLPNRPMDAMLPGPTDLQDQPRAVYIGDVRESRGLFAMVEALRGAPDWVLDIVGPVAPADQERLNTVLTDPVFVDRCAHSDATQPGAPAHSVPLRVRVHGRLPPTQAWQYAARAWCGLLLLSDTPAFREAVPSKLFEYLACGLPVITTDLPRQASIVQESGAGIIVPVSSDPEAVGAAVASQLTAMAEQHEPLAAMRDAARAYARRDGVDGRVNGVRSEGLYAAFAQRVAALL